MQEKVYKSRLYRILLMLVYGVAATTIVWVIAYNFLAPLYAAIIAVLAALIYIWLVIIDCFIKIIVKDGRLIVVKGKKRQEFIIDECGFKAKTSTSSGETSCYLTVIDSQGDEHGIDCELIGIGQFNKLMEDLGIIGDGAKAHIVTTKKRGE